MHGAPVDMAGVTVAAEDFLAAVLDATAQPIWVVDPEDLIRFANPAAIAALGYDGAKDLFGRPSHEAIHYQHPDGTPYPAADCPMLLPRATGETVTSDLDWFFRRDGSIFPVSYVSVPVEMREGRGAVVAFTDIEERLHAERELREHDAVLAEQQASLRRVASLVAGGQRQRTCSLPSLGRSRACSVSRLSRCGATKRTAPVPCWAPGASVGIRSRPGAAGRLRAR
jgi:PAS domain S-box-containing protein